MPTNNYSFAHYIEDEAAKIKRAPKGNKDGVFYSSNPARDFIYDASSPRELRAMHKITSWDELKTHLYFQDACDEAIKAARTVWRRYEKVIAAQEAENKEA